MRKGMWKKGLTVELWLRNCLARSVSVPDRYLTMGGAGCVRGGEKRTTGTRYLVC